VHCNENPIYAFPEKKLRGLREGSRTHVISGKGVLCNENPIYVIPEKKLGGLREGSRTHVIAGKGVHCNENPTYVFPEKRNCATSVPISTFMCL
jgi:hypothetical protein